MAECGELTFGPRGETGGTAGAAGSIASQSSKTFFEACSSGNADA